MKRSLKFSISLGVILVLVLILLLVILVRFPDSGKRVVENGIKPEVTSDKIQGSSRETPSGLGVGPVFFSKRPQSSTRSILWTPDQARAWAHIFTGQTIDANAQKHIPFLKAFVPRVVVTPGMGYATVTPQGILSQGTLPEGNAQELLKGLSTARLDHERQCHLVPNPGAVTSPDPQHHEVTGPGVWASWDHPGGDLVVRVPAEEEYAVAIFCDDPGAVRLNGGLIIPGRFYRIDQTTTITGGAVKIHLRPRSCLKQFIEGPLSVPASDG